MRPQWASASAPPQHRDTGPSDHVRLVVKMRAGGRCESCNAVVGCQIHHRRPRGMGGTRDERLNRPSNLVFLCGSATSGCHGLVESQRANARAAGFLVANGANPADVPVQLWDGRLVYLTDDGYYIEGKGA